MLTAEEIAPADCLPSDRHLSPGRGENLNFYVNYAPCKLGLNYWLGNGIVFSFFAFPLPLALTQSKFL